jgi:membrane associated rhomboid family serine protease
MKSFFSLFIDFRAILHQVTTVSCPSVSFTFVVLSILFHFYNWNSSKSWVNYCISEAPSIIEPLPFLGDSRAVLHAFASESFHTLPLQSLTLVILGNYLERRLGSIVFFLIFVVCDLLVAFIALAMPLTQCYGSQGLWPGIVALSALLHAENPRLFPEAVPRNIRPASAVEPRWAVWFLVFVNLLISDQRPLYVYFVSLAVGISVALSFHADTRRALWRTYTFRRSVILKFILFFSSIHILPFIFYQLPRSLTDSIYLSSSSLYALAPNFTIDAVSRVAIELLAVSPLLYLSSAHFLSGRFWILGLVVLVYILQGDLLPAVPNLGLLGLLYSLLTS